MKKWKLPTSTDTQEVCRWTNIPEGQDQSNLKWIEPYEFEDTLEFITIARGRSALNFIFKSVTNGRRYHFGSSGFITACKLCKVVGIAGGFTVAGRFGFVKRGQNYLTEAVPSG
jgi:hypothetical protein